MTNAAGGLDPEYNVGDIVVLNDVRSVVLLILRSSYLASTSIWPAWQEIIRYGDQT